MVDITPPATHTPGKVFIATVTEKAARASKTATSCARLLAGQVFKPIELAHGTAAVAGHEPTKILLPDGTTKPLVPLNSLVVEAVIGK